MRTYNRHASQAVEEAANSGLPKQEYHSSFDVAVRSSIVDGTVVVVQSSIFCVGRLHAAAVVAAVSKSGSAMLPLLTCSNATQSSIEESGLSPISISNESEIVTEPLMIKLT